MATTKNTRDKSKDKTPPDPNALRVEVQPDDSHSEKLAALATDGALTAITMQAYAGGGKELGVTELLAAMRKAGDETVAGDMGRFERVLTHQFLTLDALFNNLAQRSGRQESFKGIEVLMRLALKAQSQARATAETLALMKNPMPYIKQANIANGPQQVNNGNPASAGKNQSPPNELLEHQHGNTLDIGAAATAGRADLAMATVEAKHRPTNNVIEASWRWGIPRCGLGWRCGAAERWFAGFRPVQRITACIGFQPLENALDVGPRFRVVQGAQICCGLVHLQELRHIGQPVGDAAHEHGARRLVQVRTAVWFGQNCQCLVHTARQGIFATTELLGPQAVCRGGPTVRLFLDCPVSAVQIHHLPGKLLFGQELAQPEMEQLMEQSPLHSGPVTKLVAEQVDGAIVDSARHVVIACDTRQLPKSSVPDPNRGLLRKATDALFHFIGYHRVGEPFRNRLRD